MPEETKVQQPGSAGTLPDLRMCFCHIHNSIATPRVYYNAFDVIIQGSYLNRFVLQMGSTTR